MAWVNRTSRDQGPGNFTAQCGLSSLQHLGPGCYDTASHRRIRPNAAPFGSGETSERGNVCSTTLITPGPGAYSNNNQATWDSPTKSKAPATSVFQSKSQRSSETLAKNNKGSNNNNTPGPGAYTRVDSFATKKKKSHSNVGAMLAKKQGKVKWTRIPTAPSIPTMSQSFGYEQGPYGKLVRYEPAHVGHSGCGDDTLGPGEYDPMHGLKSVNKSRAADFSKGKITRVIEQEIKAKAAIPGPGQYKDPTESLTKEAIRSSAVFKSSLTRDQASVNNNHSLVPGPGAYKNLPHTFETETKPEHLQFFGSTVTRFESSQRESFAPGPGAYYYSPPSPTVRPSSTANRKHAPFSSKKERFDTKPKDEYLAAPGSYEVRSSVSETLHKVTSRVNTFGSTTKRFDSISSTYDRMPETMESQLEKDMKCPRKDIAGNNEKKTQQNKLSSSFASSTTRFQQQRQNSGVSPGDYEIQSSWDAPGAQGTFKSGIDRMKEKPRGALDVPGPGHYSTAASVQKPLHMARPDVFYAAEPRFKQTLPKVQAPGPGQYNTTTTDIDWNRPTYNITIATEMELAILH